MTTARDLALELSQLPAAQREQLLCELPEGRRAQLEELLSEIASMLDAPCGSFDRHLAAAAAEPAPPPFLALNDGQLRLLMSAEHASVQKRIAAAIRNGQLSQLAPAVASVVAEYLSRKLPANEIRNKVPHRTVRWWSRWKRA